MKGIREFLGFARYHCRFVPNFAEVAAPMIALTAKTEFVWSTECVMLFDKLQQALLAAPGFSISPSQQAVYYWIQT
jgi:hypothetical protein